MQTIGVIGNGILGNAIVRGFMEWGEVKVWDLDPARATHSKEEAANCDIVFLALPTPAKLDGGCDTSAIEGFLEWAEIRKAWKPESCMVLRSTVPVGFTQRQVEKRAFKLPLLHSPEFLTARCAVTDFQTPARNIIGTPYVPDRESGTPDPQTHAKFEVSRMRLGHLYQDRFPGVKNHFMPSNASELVKLACNTFFGAKVTMFNLFSEIAEAAGVDWKEVREGILSDGRIAHAHTAVAAAHGGVPGFGGACLPKDIADLYVSGTALGVDCELIREVIERNDRIRRPFDPGLTQIQLSSKDA